MSPAIYRLEKISRVFSRAAESVTVLDSIDLEIQEGQSLAVSGASGSGKSTLLHILGTLDDPSSGRIFFNETDLGLISPEKKAELRQNHMGFIFQFHHLLPEFSTIENVAVPAIIQGVDRKTARRRALAALDQVGLADRADQRVTTLSGGESQRVAIARAVMSSPRVLLADEPTGNLDLTKGREIGELLLRLNRQMNMTLIVVTHNLELAQCMNLNYELKAGKLYALSKS
ncbi:MAG: ABC transporter ATP-binding protein [Desulfonatronovibrionaceae bacterium]